MLDGSGSPTRVPIPGREGKLKLHLPESPALIFFPLTFCGRPPLAAGEAPSCRGRIWAKLGPGSQSGAGIEGLGGVGRRDAGSGGCLKMADVAAGLKPEGAAYWSRDRILSSGRPVVG